LAVRPLRPALGASLFFAEEDAAVATGTTIAAGTAAPCATCAAVATGTTAAAGTAAPCATSATVATRAATAAATSAAVATCASCAVAGCAEDKAAEASALLGCQVHLCGLVAFLAQQLAGCLRLSLVTQISGAG